MVSSLQPTDLVVLGTQPNLELFPENMTRKNVVSFMNKLDLKACEKSTILSSTLIGYVVSPQKISCLPKSVPSNICYIVHSLNDPDIIL